MHKITTDLLPLAVDIKTIKPDPANPRENHDVDGIAKSFNDYGQCETIVVNRKTRMIEAGHGRLYAAQKLGWSEIAVNFVDHDDQQAIGYNIAANRLSDKSSFDDEKLLTLLQSLDEPLSVPGIDDAFMAELLENVGGDLLGGEGDEDLIEDEVPLDKAEELLKKWQCEVGDLWLIGEHRLICGDCTDKATVERLMNGENPDMVFADPPYGMELDTSNSNRIMPKGDWKNTPKKYSRVIGDNDDFSENLILSIFDNYGDCKEMFLWGADYYSELIKDRKKGSWFVWDKRATVEDVNYQGAHFELCWSKQKHNRDMVRIAWFGLIGTEKEFDHKRHHPTQKPTLLAKWFIERYSKENNLIIDPFLGSGTTMVAAHQVSGGRRCYGCEIEPKYAAVICERMSLLGLTPELSKE